MTPTPTLTPTITTTPFVGALDIYTFEGCCYPYTKFRIEELHATIVVGQTYLIEGGTFTESLCATVIPYEETGLIYLGDSVTFMEQDDCNDLDCPSCPFVESFEPITLFTMITGFCVSYNITNTFDLPQEVYYTDCFNNNISQNVGPFTTISICAEEDSVIYPSGIFINPTGDCPPISPTPQPTPSVTPTISPTPSSGWNLCNEDFCLVTYDSELDLYNGTYSVSGVSVFNDRYVFSGDVLGVIYYNSTTLQWCLSDTIGGSCLFGGPTPSTSSCPDLWDVTFTQGFCDTTTSTTSPCDVFDFTAFFDCDVPDTPTPTPTNSPTPTHTPTPTPSVNICNFATGSISISAFTTTTTTIPTTTTTTTICYEPLFGDVIFTLVETTFVCPGDNYQFTSCDGETVYYIEPSNTFIGVDLITGFTYSMTINGDNGCFVFDGATSISPNGVVTNTITLFTNCDECENVSPPVSASSTPTPTPTPTVSPTVTPTISLTPTITNSPTPTPSSSEPVVEYYALVNGTYCCGDLPPITNLLVRRVGFPIQNGFVYYDGEGNCFTITTNTPTVAGPGFTDITTNFVDCSSCRNNNLTFFLAGYCYDGRMLADSGSPFTNCLQVQSGLGSATRYRSNYPYSYLFTGQWQTVDMYIMDVTTNCLLVSKPISDGCQYWETNSLGIVSIGYPQSGFDCVPAGGPCCPGSSPG